MKYFDWLDLKTLKLIKYIENPTDEKITDVTIEDEYEPRKLSQKIFSFNLFFKETPKYNYTYIFGLIFNYKIFLYGLSKGHFKDYKFRVYVDKKSFIENENIVFYLMMLKKLEKDFSLELDKVNYNWLEIIMCSWNDSTDQSFIMTLRFLPIFEGCECHSRDLDFRLSSYDIELIKRFDESEYPFYFHSVFGVINPILGGCVGGNIKKRFLRKRVNNINENIFKFYTPECFIAFIIICKNMFIAQFGFDEFVFRFYMSLLSDTFLENVLLFGATNVDFVREYLHPYIYCIMKNSYNTRVFYPVETSIIGIDFSTKIFNGPLDNSIVNGKFYSVSPLIKDFKLKFDSELTIKEQTDYLTNDYNPVVYWIDDTYFDKKINYKLMIDSEVAIKTYEGSTCKKHPYITNSKLSDSIQEPLSDIIERIKDTVSICSINKNYTIKLKDGTIIYNEKLIPLHKCEKILNKTSLQFKFIRFIKSRLVFIFILNSDDEGKYVFLDNKVCGFGKRFIDTHKPDENTCIFYNIDDLELFDDKTKTGGNFNYYEKYIKYKNKYLKLRDSQVNHAI